MDFSGHKLNYTRDDLDVAKEIEITKSNVEVKIDYAWQNSKAKEQVFLTIHP